MLLPCRVLVIVLILPVESSTLSNPLVGFYFLVNSFIILLFFRPQFTGKYTVLYMNPLSIAARRTGGKRVEVPTGIRV